MNSRASIPFSFELFFRGYGQQAEKGAGAVAVCIYGRRGGRPYAYPPYRLRVIGGCAGAYPPYGLYRYFVGSRGR